MSVQVGNQQQGWWDEAWSAVPGQALVLYARLVKRAAALAAATPLEPTDRLWLAPAAGQLHLQSWRDGWTPLPPAAEPWILIKTGSAAWFQPLGNAWRAAQRPLGGPNLLSAALVSGLLGSGLGYGAGYLGEQILPERYFERGKLRRSGALLGGMAGAVPFLAAGAVGAGMPARQTGGPAAMWLNGFPFWRGRAAAAAPAAAQQLAVEKVGTDEVPWPDTTGAFYAPTIPVDAFNRAVWSDVDPNPYGTKSTWGDNRQPLTTPPMVAAATAGLVAGAAAPLGQQAVSPVHVGLLAAQTGGAGFLTGMGVGKVLGALAGLRPAAQQQLQQTGLWAGVLTGAIKGLFGG